MKRALLILLLSTNFAISVFAEEVDDSIERENIDNEIFFRDVPWGSTYSEVKSKLYEFDWYEMYFDYMKTHSVGDIIYGDYKGIDFINGGFNMTALPFSNKEINVAGYTTSDINLYFVFPITENGLEIIEDDAIFYGATYEFEPQDYESMYDDLREKLTSLYGEPIKEDKETDWLGIEETCTVWEGTNDVLVSLRGEDVENEEELWEDSLTINYAWKEGDNLLTAASEQMKKEALDEESNAYGNDDTSGL